jgi:Rrf2 family protein
MLSVTRKTDYALVALAFLGQRKAAGEASVSARRIADQFHLPLPLLMNVLKALSQARLVTSTRGQQGGYALAADPEEINLLDIVTAIEGTPRFAPCTDELPILGQTCPIQNCLIRTPVRRLHDRIKGFLRETTLADLMETQLVDVRLEAVGVAG